MPTHAEMASQLLRDAAAFFRSIADQNIAIKAQMLENAAVYEQVGILMERDPQGVTNDKTNAGMASSLLQDAAGFFKRLGEKNEPIQDQMEQNARVFEQLSALVENDPLGILD
jgi:hypothetical protein